MKKLLNIVLASTLLGSFSLASAKNTAGEAADAKMATQITGHWGGNLEATKKALTAAAEGQGEEAQEGLKFMIGMMTEMADKLVLHFTDKGKAIAYTNEGKEPADFKITKEDASTGEFTLVVTEKGDEDENIMSCRLKHGDLRMTMDGDEMIVHFERLKTKVAKERIKKILAEAEKEDGGGIDEAPDPDVKEK